MEVWKYTIDIRMATTQTGITKVLAIPEKAMFLKVRDRPEDDWSAGGPYIELWYLVDRETPPVDTTFELYMTGETIKEPDDLYYVATVFPVSGYVLHIFQRSLLKTSSE